MSIRDFEIGKELGKGAFGSVFIVKRKEDTKIYAMKRVKITQLNTKERENALNEVRILASLNHPNIVGYKEAFFEEDSKTLNIVMEYADDGDLESKIQKSIKTKTPYSEKDIWNVLRQIIQGLKYLHDNKVMHRDLKCANIFLMKNGMVKLGDLNVSKIVKMGMCSTQTGTPYYASPEVWADKPYDYKSDVWSVGCIIYELCTLRPPFRGQNLDQLYKNVTKGIYDPIPPSFSKDLSTIISLMLQTNPSRRVNADDLLKNEILLKRMNLIVKENSHTESDPPAQLLATIKLPRNISEINQRLPKKKMYIRENENNLMDMNNKDIKRSKTEEKKDNNNNGENINLINVKNLNLQNQYENSNRYNLNYNYNDLILNRNKGDISNRNEKQENRANYILESLNKLKSEEYEYNDRYNLIDNKNVNYVGNGINVNLENLNKNNGKDIKISNLNIDLKSAEDLKNLKNNLNEPIVNLNLNLNINNNIINNISTPNKINTHNLQGKRAVSSKADSRPIKKENIIELNKKNEKIDNYHYNSKNKNRKEEKESTVISTIENENIIKIKNDNINLRKNKSNENKTIEENIKKSNDKVDPFDFDFLMNKIPKNDKDKRNKNEMSDLINYQDSDLITNNYDYLNIRGNNNLNLKNNEKNSPYRIINNENVKIENVISTPNLPQKISNLINNPTKNNIGYNKSPYSLLSDQNRDDGRYKINNLNKPSRPESAKVPTSVRVTKKILESNQINKGISPFKNLNLNNVNNYNLNNYNSKLKPRNLTPLKPIEGYKSPIILPNHYSKKNVISSNLNIIPTNPTPVRARPLSGVNPNLQKLNNIGNKHIRSSLITNIKNDPKENLNIYNKRNYTPTPSNVKSHRYEIDANRRNYGINLSNNVVERNRVDNYVNKVSNLINKGKNLNLNIPSSRGKIDDKIKLEKINNTPIIRPLNKLNNADNDYNYYNQVRNVQNMYNVKMNNDILKINYNNNYVNNIYNNIYGGKDNFPSITGVNSGPRIVNISNRK